MRVQRIKDLGAIEARFLELAHTTDVALTAPALAYFAPCSIEDADRVLDDLATRSVVTMEVRDDGSIVYELPGRQRFAPRPAALAPVAPVAPMGPPATHALAPIAPGRYGASPVLAALLSIWIPGAGHVYAGRVAAAILWFLVVGLGYALIVPGLVLHLFCILSAATSARRLEPPPPRPLLMA